MPRSSATVPPSGERALKRMRVYTSISLATVVLLFGGIVLFQTSHPALIAAVVVTSLVTTAYAVFWENGAPLALTIATFAVSAGAWIATVAMGELPGPYFFVALAFGIFGFTHRHARWARAFAAALVVGIAPVVGAVLLGAEIKASAYVAAVIAALIASFGLFALNRYAFNLYLEIDDARRVGAELAVVQERYRFAADLHDIQGHTLHVIRLKMQLADRLLDHDPDGAHTHLQEAQALIAQTLADTRGPAFGDRHVAFASELANAEALLVAAGIDWSVTGTLPRGAHDELFGLLMREATTNILRHAQATTVRVTLAPGSVSVANDGSPRTGRTLSGLARLAERFEAVGGALRTDSADGTFTTTAEAP